MRRRHLQVSAGVPVRVVHDDSANAGEVGPQPARPRSVQEHPAASGSPHDVKPPTSPPAEQRVNKILKHYEPTQQGWAFNTSPTYSTAIGRSSARQITSA